MNTNNNNFNNNNIVIYTYTAHAIRTIADKPRTQFVLATNEPRTYYIGCRKIFYFRK